MATTALVLWQGRIHSYQLFETEIFAIDVVVLAALVWLALASDHYWPLFVAGFHAAGTAIHAAVLAETALRPLAYAHALGLFAYLMLIALAVGTRLEGRQANASATSVPSSPQSAEMVREIPPVA